MDIEGKRAFVISFLYGLIWIGIGYLLLKYGLPLVTPFLMAFMVAYLLRRPIRFVSREGKVPYKMSAVLIVTVFYGVIGMLVCLLGVKTVTGLGTVLEELPKDYTQQVEPWLNGLLEGVKAGFASTDASVLNSLNSISEQMLRAAGELVSKASLWAMGFVSDIAIALPKLVVELMLMIIATFFIAADYETLRESIIRKLGEKPKALLLDVKTYVTGTLFICLRAYLLIMTVTFLELSVGLTLIDVEHAILVAGCIAVFDILPVFGTGGIMLPWAGIALIQGQYRLAISLLLLYAVITIVRNVIEPKIVGTQLGLHPIITLISMYVGVQLAGVIGLFGGPILLSLLKYLQQNGNFQVQADRERV